MEILYPDKHHNTKAVNQHVERISCYHNKQTHMYAYNSQKSANPVLCLLKRKLI